MNKNQLSLGSSYTLTLDSPLPRPSKLHKRNLRRLYRKYLFSYTFETLPTTKA